MLQVYIWVENKNQSITHRRTNGPESRLLCPLVQHSVVNCCKLRDQQRHFQLHTNDAYSVCNKKHLCSLPNLLQIVMEIYPAGFTSVEICNGIQAILFLSSQGAPSLKAIPTTNYLLLPGNNDWEGMNCRQGQRGPLFNILCPVGVKWLSVGHSVCMQSPQSVQHFWTVDACPKYEAGLQLLWKSRQQMILCQRANLQTPGPHFVLWET